MVAAPVTIGSEGEKLIQSSAAQVDVTTAFLEGKYLEVLALPSRNDLGSLFLACRALVRLKRPHEALVAARRTLEIAESPEDRVIANALNMIAEIGVGDAASADLRSLSARPTKWPSVYAQAEFGYAAALTAYTRGDLDAADERMVDAFADDSFDIRARARNLTAHLASARGDFRRHADLLVQSFATFDQQRDVYGKAHLVYDLSIVARETQFALEFEAIEAAFTSLPWVPATAHWHYLTCENVAWRHALDGSYLRAYRLLEQALSIAPSDAWRAWTHADFAQFAMSAGEHVNARLHIGAALSIARSTNWAECHGEERTALLEIATLVAESDPADARELLACYAQLFPLGPEYAFAHDDRATAEYNLALGLQDPQDPTRAARLKSAHSTFAGIGYLWRAGVAARALARASEDPEWRRIARYYASQFPRSWLAHGLDLSTALRARYPSLSPRQLAVAEMLTAGIGDKEIAARLGVSWHTARNHVNAVLTKTNLHSRHALRTEIGGMG